MMARSNRFHDTKRNELIQIALDLFMEYGYEDTKISQIMKAANLSRGGMYHYFSSKEEVLDAVIAYAMSEELTKLEEKLAQVPIEQKMITFIGHQELGEFTAKLMRFRDNNKNSIVGYRVREYNVYSCIPILTQIIEQGVEAGIYKVTYPKQIAEFASLLIRAISDTNLLPPVNKEEQIKRVKVFVNLTNAALQCSPEHLGQMKHFIESALLL